MMFFHTDAENPREGVDLCPKCLNARMERFLSGEMGVPTDTDPFHTVTLQTFIRDREGHLLCFCGHKVEELL